MNTLEILTAARAKIADEKNWCQGGYAKDEGGNSTSSYSTSACKWCSIGALKSVSGESYAGYNNALDCLVGIIQSPIPNYNDTHTHAEVLAAWDKAIAECAKEYNEN
jgi:hypothetical protein